MATLARSSCSYSSSSSRQTVLQHNKGNVASFFFFTHPSHPSLCMFLPSRSRLPITLSFANFTHYSSSFSSSSSSSSSSLLIARKSYYSTSTFRNTAVGGEGKEGSRSQSKGRSLEVLREAPHEFLVLGLECDYSKLSVSLVDGTGQIRAEEDLLPPPSLREATVTPPSPSPHSTGPTTNTTNSNNNRSDTNLIVELPLFYERNIDALVTRLLNRLGLTPDQLSAISFNPGPGNTTTPSLLRFPSPLILSPLLSSPLLSSPLLPSLLSSLFPLFLHPLSLPPSPPSSLSHS
jgi:hypothetical protein